MTSSNIRTEKTSRIIILGSGPAGYTAALYAARANLLPLLITGIAPGGQLMTTNEVENWPGDAHNLQGPGLMERMRIHAEKFNTKLIFDHIHKVDLRRKPFTLIGENNNTYRCDALIIATGAQAKYLGLPSEELFKGRGVSACATCDGFFFKNQDVAIVGGGNTAVEEALYLSKIASKVTLIHRGHKLTAEPILIDRIQNKTQEGKIAIRFNYVVDEIIGDKFGVNAIRIKSTKQLGMDIVAVKGCFIAIGHKPSSEIFNGLLDMENGYIKTGKNLKHLSTMTSIAGVFAAGDVQDPIYRQAITSAASGCMAALDAQRFLEETQNSQESYLSKNTM